MGQLGSRAHVHSARAAQVAALFATRATGVFGHAGYAPRPKSVVFGGEKPGSWVLGRWVACGACRDRAPVQVRARRLRAPTKERGLWWRNMGLLGSRAHVHSARAAQATALFAFAPTAYSAPVA
jgi:hypothetical protein